MCAPRWKATGWRTSCATTRCTWAWTEAGLPADGIVKSAIGIGALLLDGIGDTIRVSLTANPVEEIAAAKQILRAIGQLEDSVEVISCPTCGRTRIDVAEIARRVFDGTRHIKRPLKVAVMGCVVNGPGEARNADIGIAGAAAAARCFARANRPVKVEGDLAQILLDASRRRSAITMTQRITPTATRHKASRRQRMHRLGV